MNKCFFVGRISSEINLAFIPGNGKAVAKFTLAVNRFKKDEADFLRCVAFDKRAEAIANFMQKGSQIAIEGHIQTGSYEGKDGHKVYTTDIVVDGFDFCGSKKSESHEDTDRGYGGMTEVDEGGEIPFK